MTAFRFATGILVAGLLSAQPSLPRVLYVTHSAGFKHQVLPLTEEILPEIGKANGFEVTVAREVSGITAENLKGYSAIVFYTTGELPMSEDQKRAFLSFISDGRGFVGIHSATDTFYKWPEYGKLVGGYFDNHPWHKDVTIRNEDPAHPATRHLPTSFTLNDEVYQFRDWSRSSVRVLLSLDPTSVDLAARGVKRTDKDFALAWTNTLGKGRMFYTALGHEPAVWRDERFQRHLAGGIRWAAGLD
jgi:type 1 glutamine amidotransferase